MGIKVVIWDVDGTLLNTNDFIRDSVNERLKKYGCKVKFLNQSFKDLYKSLSGKVHNLPSLAELAKDCFGHIEESFLKMDSLELMDGVKESLALLESKNIEMMIASNGHNSDTLLKLEKGRIYPKFSFIATAEMVENGKPAPDMINLCLKNLSVSDEEVLFIDDSLHGIMGGVNAGVKTLLVNDNKKILKKGKEHGVDFVIDSMKNFDWEEVLG